MESEAVLVELCLSGDQSAMDRFVQRFRGLVFGRALRMLRRREDAEDISQDVFLRTFRNLHRWDRGRPIVPWLTTITTNRCRTALGRRPLDMQPVDVRGVAAPPITDDRELAEELGLALQALRPDYRRCFELFHRDELSVAEVADRLGVPQGTVKTWLHRSRRELAAQLVRRGSGETK